MSIYDIVEVAAKTAKPTTIRSAIRTVLLANGGECYRAVEPFLVPPGKSGSRSFDQAYAVNTLLNCDSEQDGTINTIMLEGGMTHRLLWDHLQAELRNIGFKMSHGRLTGLLEHKSKPEEDSGQPDID